MNIDDLQLIESLAKDGDTSVEGGDWSSAKISYLRALEEFDRNIREDPENPITENDKVLRKTIEANLLKADEFLAQSHLELGMAALESKDFPRAIDELEEAINLASESNLAFLEEAKKHLDKARLQVRDREIYDQITPAVQHGDEFRATGAFAEAILEYQEALKTLGGLPTEHRFVTYIRDSIRECRRALVRSYLKRAHRAEDAKKYLRAYKILQRALLIVDEDDFIYRAFLDQIRERLDSTLKPHQLEEGTDEEAPEKWAAAVKDYEEALNLYSSYTDVDPLSPVYSGKNQYEDHFLQARRRLANLYRERGDRLRDKAELEKALRSYKEALKLFPRADKVFHETFREIKKLRAQLGSSANTTNTH